ncbi:hypothetical protein BHE74_00047868 [Ensete ventricosum]|nr:hypothetical protein BHE74_00047868 [Ensete ventricosum]RZS12629.1 hypothetical protein BHM03_00044106 [Ensete ventricosum]
MGSEFGSSPKTRIASVVLLVVAAEPTGRAVLTNRKMRFPGWGLGPRQVSYAQPKTEPRFWFRLESMVTGQQLYTCAVPSGPMWNRHSPLEMNGQETEETIVYLVRIPPIGLQL